MCQRGILFFMLTLQVCIWNVLLLADTFSKPNIILILADDHNRQTISSYNSKSLIKTPGIDRLAKEGMLFQHPFVTNSLCGPSRAVLVSGKYSHLNGMKGNTSVFNGEQTTFPKLLQKDGYATALFGKWHLGSQPRGFDYYAVLNGQGRYYDSPFITSDESWEGNKGKVKAGYLTDVLTDLAMEWLKQRKKDKPFLLMVHHKAVHCPHQPAERHKNLFADTVFPEPKNLYDDYHGRAPVYAGDKRFSLLKNCNDGGPYEKESRCFDDNPQKKLANIYQLYMRAYLRLVASLDENVARLLNYVDEAGLKDNTLVVYASDNGYFNGEHGFYNKMWMYEESLHVPLIIRMPGSQTAGAECRQLVGLIDLAPTFLDFAGLPPCPEFQGKSIRPLLEGNDRPVRDAAYYHYYSAFSVPEIFGCRTLDYKIIYYPTLPADHQWELFDLSRDPAEMVNKAYDPEFGGIRTKMVKKLAELAKDFGDETLSVSID